MQGRRRLTPVLVLAWLLVPCGAAQATAPPDIGRPVPVGAPIAVAVTPSEPIRVDVPGVGSLTGPRGAVTSRGRLVVQRYRASARGGVRAGLGIGVRLEGAGLRDELVVRHRRVDAPAGAIGLAVERRDGAWKLQAAALPGEGLLGRIGNPFRYVTMPVWMEPPTIGRWLGDRLAASVAGRTDPWPCPVTPPSWFSVVKQTELVHACGMGNDDAIGERGEVRIKSNRGYVLQVSVDGPRDYVWVQDQPDLYRAALGRALGTDPATVVYLAPGDEGLMTVGYRRPPQDTTAVLHAEVTYRSLLLTTTNWLLDLVAGKAAAKAENGAAIYMLAQCTEVVDLPNGQAGGPDELTADTLRDFLVCMVEEAAEELEDPDKALLAAIALNDQRFTGLTDEEYAKSLSTTGRNLLRAAKVLVLRPILQQGLGGIVDTANAMLSGGTSGQITVTLRGPGGTPAPAPAS